MTATLTEMEVWELVVPDEVIPCWVYTTSSSYLCPEFVAVWLVRVHGKLTEQPLCDGCKNRWQSYGNVRTVRPLVV